MPDPVVLVADAGKEAGLGHLSRSSAVAAALRCRGVAVECYVDGVDEPVERDAVLWSPLGEERTHAFNGRVLVIDSYRLPREELATAAAANRLVVMHDSGAVPHGSELVVSPAGEPSPGETGWLTGLEYAALRPDFWGLPTRNVREPVEQILVTTGSGHFVEMGLVVAAALAERLPTVQVALVRGPHANVDPPEGVDVLDAPDSLLEPLLTADVAVTAAGQTMLEAAAVGTPCVAVPLIENQRRQAELLARIGAVRLVDPPDAGSIRSAAIALSRNPAARRWLSVESQRAIDGYGALRVAFHVAQLAGSIE